VIALPVAQFFTQFFTQFVVLMLDAGATAVRLGGPFLRVMQ
jgi:hypothetical protein